MSTTFDCTNYSKAALKAMRQDPVFASYHEVIDFFLAPKPKELEQRPVDEGKQIVKIDQALSLVIGSKGWAKPQSSGRNRDLCIMYKDRAIAVANALLAAVEDGRIKDRPAS